MQSYFNWLKKKKKKKKMRISSQFSDGRTKKAQVKASFLLEYKY